MSQNTHYATWMGLDRAAGTVFEWSNGFFRCRIMRRVPPPPSKAKDFDDAAPTQTGGWQLVAKFL